MDPSPKNKEFVYIVNLRVTNNYYKQSISIHVPCLLAL